MMGYDGFGWLFGGGLMMLPMLLFWIVPIALVVWGLTRRDQPRGVPAGRTRSRVRGRGRPKGAGQ